MGVGGEVGVETVLLDEPVSPNAYGAQNLFATEQGNMVFGASCAHGGVASDLILVDEAGFTKNLKYLVQDILLPQTITTNGRVS